MKVLIVEKPSMVKKYKEATGEVVVNSVGHIEKLIQLEEYFGKEKMKWSELIEKLPYIPNDFKIEIDKPDIYKKIVDKLKEATEVILCCDPDREGELIHRNILDIAKKEGYVKTNNITRVWLNSETKAGIKEAFDKRKNYLEYDGYYKTAYARMIIDWLIGIQLTVLYTVKFDKGLLSVGRIQSWLLSEIVERYNQFINFKPQDFWRIFFITKEGVRFNYTDEEYRLKNIFNEIEFNEKINLIKDKKLVIKTIEKKDFKEYAPSLYKISTLQKEAAEKYKITPKETLETLQKLYNEYNLITYPRTDCDVLSEEEAKYLNNSLELINKFSEYKQFVEVVKKENPDIIINKKYIGKIKGHFAIIPVFNYDKSDVPILKDNEKKIFELIVKRFIATLLPPVIGEKTTIKAHIEEKEEEKFLANIKNIIDEGYRKYFTEKEENEDENIVSVNYKESNLLEGKIENKKEKTSPKPLFKDSTIIGLMENAHLQIKDEKIKESLKNAEGIGTGATRDSFIPILIERGYIVEEKKNYIPTQRGLDLYSVLPEELKLPDFSAKLEYEFSKIIEGNGKKIEDFLEETKEFIEKIFNKIRYSEKIFNEEKRETIGICPSCGRDIIKGKKGYGCIGYKEGCKFVIWEEIAGKKLSEKNIKELLEKGKTSLIKGFEGKNGKFDAYLKLENNKVEFEFEKEEKDKLICPSCSKGEIVEREKFFGCTNWKEGCKFSINKEISGKKLTKKNIEELVLKGKTGIIKGFKNKAEKEFDAILKLENNKVVFDFK